MKRSYIILLLLVLISLTCGKKDRIVATIGKEKSITVPELITYYNQRNSQKASDVPYSKLKDALDKMIEDEIKIKAAYEMKLDQDSTLQRIVENYRGEFMLGTLREIEIIDQVVNESIIRDYYNKSSKEVEYQDLFIPVERSASPDVKEEKRKKAEMIVKALRDGKEFSQLITESSQDPDMYITGKIISYTRVNDPFQTKVFALRLGETSDVIHDHKGFHIIYIKKFHPKDIEPYKQKRDEIRGKLSRQLTFSIQKEAQKYLEKVVQRAEIIWNEETLDVIYNHLQSIEPREQFAKTVHDTLMNLSADERQLNLLILNDEKISVHNFADILTKYNPQTSFDISDTEKLKGKITEFLPRKLLIDKALSLHLDTHMEVLEKLRQLKESYLIRMLHKQGIFKAEEPTEEEIYNYYIDHKDDTYSHLKDRDFKTIKLQVKRDLERKLSDGKKNEWLAEKKNEYQVTVFDNVLREIANG